MLYRHDHGKDIYMLPGGTVEDGETPEQAVAREIKEETSIESEFVRKIDSFTTPSGRTHHTFEFKYVSGIPLLLPDSPENIGASRDDYFEALWVDTALIKDFEVWPEESKKYFQ